MYISILDQLFSTSFIYVVSISINVSNWKTCLHLVWSASFISKAVRTALKVARTPQILGENGNYRSHYKSKKRIDFEMGPSLKFVSSNKGLISKKKLGVNFFCRKNDQTVGGVTFRKKCIFGWFFLLTGKSD